MADYEELLTNELTGERVWVKSNDRYTFLSKKEKKLEQWKKQNWKLKTSEEAERRTKEAQKDLKACREILAATLKVDDTIDWEKLRDKRTFKKFKAPDEPKWKDFASRIPPISFFEKIPLLGLSRKHRRLRIEKEVRASYEKAVLEYKSESDTKHAAYEKNKNEFLNEQTVHNGKIEQIKNAYEEKTTEGVVAYFALVLEASNYPSFVSLNSSVAYVGPSRTLIVDMDLPTQEALPSVVEYKFVTSKGEIQEKALKKKEVEELFNSVLYQIVIRTIHEVIESDYSKAVDLVVFNGWVDGIDRKTGNPFRNCIASVQVVREEFEKINLARIDPQECFRYLKGVSAGSLVNLAPVKPLMALSTNDERIIQADSIIDDISESTNLATMDWQQFEILVRDLIAKEFTCEGCKVEVTRASRDAGVDAIAFDTDAIRGGKFVIQAKRYNNIVPLSAARDLYGTVVNEGAVKGILITTSYYGKDSLEFVKNKPLTLINGEELVYLFNKHGYQMKIEIVPKERRGSKVAY